MDGMTIKDLYYNNPLDTSDPSKIYIPAESDVSSTGGIKLSELQNVTYTLTTDNDKVVLAGSDQSTSEVTVPYSTNASNDSNGNNIASTYATKTELSTEVNARSQADTAIQTQVDNIVNGTTVVGKASKDSNGNNIASTYATRAELATVATTGDYDDLIDKPTAGTNIEISASNVISAPNVSTKSETVGSFTLSIDPSTYVVSLQAKDVNGTNLGTAQTIDLPIESMVVSGSYDDATQSITLTLQNGQSITFSVAGLVSGLQTQLTFDSTPTNDSTNPVTSGGVYSALANKQNTLTTSQASAVNSGITSTLVTKLNGIASGAEVNVQPDWSQTDNTKDDYIKNKPTLGTAAAKAYTTSVTSGSADLVTSGGVYTALQNVVPSTVNVSNATGVLAASHGGTGKTTLDDAGNAIINALSTGSSTPTDSDYYVSQYAGGGTTTTTYHRRPVSALWEYIKSKISSVLGLTASAYGGNAATATSASSASYATSAGSATSATSASSATNSTYASHIGTSSSHPSIGSSSTPVYVNSSGVVTACSLGNGANATFSVSGTTLTITF